MPLRCLREKGAVVLQCLPKATYCTASDHLGPLFDLDEARKSYYTNLFPLNPGGIVPAGPTPADLGFPDSPVAQTDATAFSYYDDHGDS